LGSATHPKGPEKEDALSLAVIARPAGHPDELAARPGGSIAPRETAYLKNFSTAASGSLRTSNLRRWPALPFHIIGDYIKIGVTVFTEIYERCFTNLPTSRETCAVGRTASRLTPYYRRSM